MRDSIACINCGPCSDTDCLCSKCTQGRGKREKVNRRMERNVMRRSKNYVYITALPMEI